jgi:hypothetical protein
MTVLPIDHKLAQHAAPIRFQDIIGEPFVGMSAAMASSRKFPDSAAMLY